MPSRRAPLIVGSFVVAASACVAPWDPPSGVVCEDGCSSTTTDPVPASTGELVPTTSTQDPGTTTGEPPGETTGEPGSTTTQGDEGEAVPTIVDFDVTPALMQDNGLIKISVSTMNADGVRMQLETGDAIELDLERPGFFTGQIGVYTGLDNDEHVAVLRPWAAVEDEPDVEGEPVDAPYYVALPPPGYEQVWNVDPIEGVSGFVVAMAVLPDRRFVELGTYYPPDGPRCFLRVGGEDGHWGPGDFMSVLPSSHCTAIDLTVNPETGALHVLVNRKGDQGVRWWLGEISSWGKGAKQIGVGEIGDEALALARHPKMLAVCGARKVATEDLDAFAMLVRPGQEIEERLFDYNRRSKPHWFSETARDCGFAGDTLVLAGRRGACTRARTRSATASPWLNTTWSPRRRIGSSRARVRGSRAGRWPSPSTATGTTSPATPASTSASPRGTCGPTSRGGSFSPRRSPSARWARTPSVRMTSRGARPATW
jgi:hypothetical protein